MDDIEKLIVEAEKNGGWSQGMTERYLAKNSRYTIGQDNTIPNYEIRPYDFGEETYINELFSGIDHGRHNVDNLEQSDHEIMVGYNEISDEIIGAIAYKGDSIRKVLSLFSVREDYRRKGLATDLIKKASQNTKQVVVNIHEDNPKSLCLAESLGFKEAETNGDYISLIKQKYFQ